MFIHIGELEDRRVGWVSKSTKAHNPKKDCCGLGTYAQVFAGAAVQEEVEHFACDDQTVAEVCECVEEEGHASEAHGKVVEEHDSRGQVAGEERADDGRHHDGDLLLAGVGADGPASGALRVGVGHHLFPLAPEDAEETDVEEEEGEEGPRHHEHSVEEGGGPQVALQARLDYEEEQALAPAADELLPDGVVEVVVECEEEGGAQHARDHQRQCPVPPVEPDLQRPPHSHQTLDRHRQNEPARKEGFTPLVQ